VASGAEGANRGAQLPAREEKKHRRTERNYHVTPKEIEPKVALDPQRQTEPRDSGLEDQREPEVMRVESMRRGDFEVVNGQ
jgi:hypothetical protein